MRKSTLLLVGLKLFSQFAVGRLLTYCLAISLNGCALLVVPTAAITIELARDRKGEFEKSRNALIGKNVLAECQAEPFEHRMFRGCGSYQKQNFLPDGIEFVFQIAPAPCAYAIVVGANHETIVGWRYISAPDACWQLYIQ